MGLAATHRFNDPLSGEGQHLVLQLSEEEAFAGPPLGVQPDRDGHRQRRLRQDVGERAAVEVVPEDVLTVLIGVQPDQKLKDVSSLGRV